MYPSTPDGRYFVVRGRLWRKTNPGLNEDAAAALTRQLMAARRAVRDAKDDAAALKKARALVNEAKIALGERGAVWWTDGSPDYNRHIASNTPYANWFATLSPDKQ